MRLRACVVALGLLIGCVGQIGDGGPGADDGGAWSMDRLRSRQLGTFDDWLTRTRTVLTPEQSETLRATGALLGLVPAADLPIKHANGMVEISEELQRRLDQTDTLPVFERFPVWWEVGLFDDRDPVQHRIALAFVAEMTGRQSPEGVGSISQGLNDATTCYGSCTITVVEPGGSNSRTCNVYNGPVNGSTSKSELQLSYTASVSVNCVFNDCPDNVAVTVFGPHATASASANGNASIRDGTRNASWATSIKVSESKSNNSFFQSLSYTIGSQVSGTSQSSGGAAGSGSATVTADAQNQLSGSAQLDASADKKSATTWQYSPTLLTNAHSIGQTAGTPGSFWLTKTNQSWTHSATAWTSGCSASLSVPLATYADSANVTASVSASVVVGSPTCSVSTGVPCTCTTSQCSWTKAPKKKRACGSGGIILCVDAAFDETGWETCELAPAPVCGTPDAGSGGGCSMPQTCYNGGGGTCPMSYYNVCDGCDYNCSNYTDPDCANASCGGGGGSGASDAGSGGGGCSSPQTCYNGYGGYCSTGYYNACDGCDYNCSNYTDPDCATASCG